MSADDRIEQARLLYERSIFDGDASALAAADRELDAVEADLALARGRHWRMRRSTQPYLKHRDEHLGSRGAERRRGVRSRISS